MELNGIHSVLSLANLRENANLVSAKRPASAVHRMEVCVRLLLSHRIRNVTLSRCDGALTIVHDVKMQAVKLQAQSCPWVHFV